MAGLEEANPATIPPNNNKSAVLQRKCVPTKLKLSLIVPSSRQSAAPDDEDRSFQDLEQHGWQIQKGA
jgi:hypothetical protein